MIVEVGPEIEQLVFEIRARPEQRAIQTLPPYRSVMWRSPLCGAERGAPRQTLVPLRLSTTVFFATPYVPCKSAVAVERNPRPDIILLFERTRL
jgi:hypothetical protein